MTVVNQKNTVPLKHACVWVTGASSGIGRALVTQLVADGNFVIVSARKKEPLHQLVGLLGSKVKPLIFDVADDANVSSVASKLGDITDYLDCVIACAGICEYENDLSFDSAMYERVINTNFLGVVRTLNIAKPLLDNSKSRAQFVAVGSLSSAIAFPRAEAYGASKAALEYFIKAANIDLSHQKLSLSLVRPGFVKTPLTQSNDFAMPAMLTADNAANRIIKGIRKRKSRIDFPKRLAWTLRFLSVFERFWIGVLGPKMTRNKKV